MRYSVERQWAVVDGHRGRVIAAFPTEGEAYRAAYKKEQAFGKKQRVKGYKANAAGWGQLDEDRIDDLGGGKQVGDKDAGL